MAQFSLSAYILDDSLVFYSLDETCSIALLPFFLSIHSQQRETLAPRETR